MDAEPCVVGRLNPSYRVAHGSGCGSASRASCWSPSDVPSLGVPRSRFFGYWCRFGSGLLDVDGDGEP